MRRTLPLVLVLIVSVACRAHADCKLPYAPPAIRARLLGFHYANEMRRERELRAGHSRRGPVQPKTTSARPARPRRQDPRLPEGTRGCARRPARA